MLHDVKDEFGRASQVWTQGGDWTVPAPLASIKSGLYVMLFLNSGALVRDANKGREKTVIHAGGASLKSGKFEHGLDDLAWRYHSHLLRDVPGEGPVHVLSECITKLQVLDLSPTRRHVPAARVFESFWNESLRHWLERRGTLTTLPKQLGRSEWRYLRRAQVEDAAFADELVSYANAVATQLEEMAAVLQSRA